MSVLYFDCGMGAAGDMITAALLDLLNNEEQNEAVEAIRNLKLPGVTFEKGRSVKCGIEGCHVTVKVNDIEETSCDYHEHEHHEHEHHEHEHHHEHTHEHGHTHHHASLKDVYEIIAGLDVDDKIKRDAENIFRIIAEAESKVHAKAIDEIHFHEVGTMDAVCDVVAVALLINKIRPDKIIASPVHVGAGKVRCAHGVLPVPTPATALILEGVPVYGGRIQGELCTPTGAAILKYYVDEFANMPPMTVVNNGYGMGNKDFEAANCIRIIKGDIYDISDSVKGSDGSIAELVCNVDDMSAEEIGYAIDVILSNGALDVFAQSIVMKKSRPGHMFTVLCKKEDTDKMVRLIMKHTSTIGIREKICERYVLNRREEITDTMYGPVRKKISEGYGVVREKYEYDDIKEIADKNNMSISEVLKKISEK